jgi:hypothetical protein
LKNAIKEKNYHAEKWFLKKIKKNYGFLVFQVVLKRSCFSKTKWLNKEEKGKFLTNRSSGRR